MNNDSGTDTKTFMLKIYSINERFNRNAPEITSKAPTDGYYKRFYSHKFTARGETPFTWSVSGDVPEGLEIDSELGTFSGVPAETGEFYFTVTVANNSGSRSKTEKLTILDVPASMLIFEKICSNPFIIRISELKGSGLNIAKIFRDNYESFKFYTSRESGVTFIEFINAIKDYIATAQLSNMTSLITAEFSGFESNQDFDFDYPDNEKANTSQLVNISESDSEIPEALTIGSTGEAHAENLEVLINNLSDDELAKITRLDFISADIENLSGLDNFTGLTKISINSCPKLKTLEVNSDFLQYASVWRCSNLQNVNASGCGKLTMLEFVNCPKLESTNLTNCTKLETLIINKANIKTLDVSDCVNLAYLDVSECSTLETISGLGDNIKTLKAAYTSLNALDLTGKNKLIHLNLNETKLTALDLSDCTELEILSLLNAANLAEVDLSKCSSLVDVYAGGTAIDKFASSSQKTLRKLDIAGCINLSGLDIANYELLEELIITGVRITELDLENCVSLVKVIANGCELLNAINLEGCDKLGELNLNGTALKELDLSGRKTLTKLDAGSCTQLANLLINDCTELEELICSGCNITSLDLTNNNKLVVLDMSMNFIMNSALNLESKYNLQELYCYGNSLAFLDLETLRLTSADFVNQTIYGFKTGLSLDVGLVAGSRAGNISNVQGYNQSGDVIPTEYEDGVAYFDKAPFAVSYEYDTKDNSRSVKMDVLLTGAEIPGTSSGYLGETCGGCNSGIHFAGLGALLMFKLIAPRKNKKK